MTGSIGPFVAIRSGADGTVVVERRVVLLSRDAGLASTVGHLLSNGDHIAHFNSAAELTDWSTPEVAVVVLDTQPNARRLTYKQIRERYDGPLVMLLNKGEPQPDLPPDGARRFLHRPFKVAELSSLLATPMPELGSLEAAIIAAWSRHAIAEPAPWPPRGSSYRVSTRHPSLRRRARAWAATVVALVGLLLAFGLSDQRGSCASACTKFGGAIAGAAENDTPLTRTPAAGSAGGGNQGGQPPGSSAGSSQPPTPTGSAGFPVVTGIGGLIESINPITSDDTTPPSGPEAVPGVPAPPGVSQPPAANPPPGTTPPPTNGPPTTTPPSTAPPTTGPPTTAPPTTDPPTTTPPTTAPPTTEPPTTAPPTTEPPTTAPPTTEPPMTEPPTTAAETTAAPTTAAETTAAPTT
jgi:hypothetical protein